MNGRGWYKGEGDAALVGPYSIIIYRVEITSFLYKVKDLSHFKNREEFRITRMMHGPVIPRMY